MIKITNEANEAVIQLFGDIGQGFFTDGWTLEKFNDAINGLDVPKIIIEIKSNGGDANEAFAIYDKIRSMPARVTVKVVGSSASAATIIAAAADRVEISENSRYLVHNARTFVEGSKENLKDAYEMLESYDNQILNVYVKRTGKSKEQLAQLMTEERWLTAEEAKQWGFVDEIIEYKPKIDNKMSEEAKNLTEEEQAAMDALTAENEALKAQVAELQGKIDEMEAMNAEKEEKEIEEFVENKIKAGIIKPEAKEHWVKLGKQDRTSMTMAIDAIYVPPAGSVATVIDRTPAKMPKNKQEAWDMYKSGELKTPQDYELAIKNLK